MKPDAALQSAPPEQQDGADAVISTVLREVQAATISVPELSRLLGVKTTTLNARFRRQHLPVTTIGRTNFIPAAVALELAGVHKYALMGWPTLLEASRVTGVKSGTIKAKCEKGKVEAYMDLTKRLRINPNELQNLMRIKERKRPPPPRILPDPDSTEALQRLGAELSPGPAVVDSFCETILPAPRLAAKVAPAPPSPRLSPDPGPIVRLITERDYGLPETTYRQSQLPQRTAERKDFGKNGRILYYDPERPFSVSECAVGRAVRYDNHEGVIAKIIDDPFRPRIQVRFPDYEHPLMQEVLLVVERRVRPA